MRLTGPPFGLLIGNLFSLIAQLRHDPPQKRCRIAFESVIRCMKEAGVGYGSVNHPVDRDPVCGYNGIIGETCPRCGRRSGEGVPLEKLEELRKKYHDVPDYTNLIS